MTPTFDFAAYLNSPAAGNEGGNGLSVTGPLSNDLVDTLDGTQATFGSGFPYGDPGLLPAWASSNDVIEESAQTPQSSLNAANAIVNLTTDQIPPVGMDGKPPTASNYRSTIAAHHLSQLRHWLPQLGGAAGGASAGLGGAGQRSQGGSFSSPSIPLSQASRAQKVKSANELTIQERRRLSRRAHAAGIGHNVASSLHKSALIQAQRPIAGLPNEKVSSEVIQSPVYNTQFSNGNSDFAKRAYSYTGFDLIGALLKVAQRPNPKIEIGPVDLSCSFTVSDALHPDQPIVHCSDTFCQLTGYSREEIIGRNCRFLQAPGGAVQAGDERMHTDNGAVKHIKKQLSNLQECQTSFINYRRDGTPFINLLTIVPITWGDSTKPVFFVGFQVDLVEQPGAVLERKPSGLCVVNYSQDTHYGPTSLSTLTDPHMLPTDLTTRHATDDDANRGVVMAQELAELIGSGSEETAKWARLLLDNSHDLIHVLSLKGTFLYVSPSVERLLGYKAEELVGRSISEFCHPSDVVPVFRELKDSTSNASIAAAARHWARVDGTVNPPTKGGAGQTGPQVNLIMRMRHKDRGYEWIENVGKLHLEQGKGRKVVISTGRPRPVYNLPWEQARRSLDHKSPGFWSKVSQRGLILSTSGSVHDVLECELPVRADGSKASLAGKHIGDLVCDDAKDAILSGLTTQRVTGIPHLISNGAGSKAVTVMSTLVPSSAGGKGLPTGFMHTQRVSKTELGTLQLNQTYNQDAGMARVTAESAASLGCGEPGVDSVFGELSTHRSSSWVFELHQLKIANKKLREEIRARQRRLSFGSVILPSVVPISPSKIKVQPSKVQPVSKAFLAPSSGFSTRGGNGSGSDVSSGISPGLVSMNVSRTDSSSSSGSGTDSTALTTSVSDGISENPVISGLKRSRS